MIVRTNFNQQEDKIYIYDDILNNNGTPIKTYDSEDNLDEDHSYGDSCSESIDSSDISKHD